MQAMRPLSNTMVQPGSTLTSWAADAGFFLEFAQHAPRQIDAIANDVVHVRRAAGKIDAARIRRMAAHLAQHPMALARDERGGGEAIANLWVGKPPVAHGDEIAEVGREVARLQNARALALHDLPAIHDEHAAVEHAGTLRAQRQPMRIDLLGAIAREIPLALVERALDLVDEGEGNRRLAHISMKPSLTITAAPPMDADTSLPPSTLRPSVMRLGRPIAKPCSTMM